MPSDKHSFPPQKFDSEGAITPIDFSPPSRGGRQIPRRRWWLWICSLTVLLVTGASLWFLHAARSVVLEVEPASATTNIDKGFHLRLVDHFLMLPGNYQIRVKAAGYQPDFRQLVVDHQSNQRHQISLVKLPGHLKIVTAPPGATVTIDKKEIGSTPLLAKQLSPGKHHLTLNHPRYLSVKHSINIEGLDKTQALAINLEPAWGHVRIASDPSGASISVDGKQQALTPASVTVVDGQNLMLNFPGRKPWQKTIRIQPDEELNLGLIPLAPADAELSINSQPTGANITVNGQYRDITPFRLELKPDQAHQIGLHLEGYDKVTRSIALKSEEKKELTISLSPRLGTVKLSVLPNGSRLLIDGKLQSHIPETLQLPARSHRFTVEKTGFLAETKTLTPKPGISQHLRFALKTPEQARLEAIPTSVQSLAGQTLKLFRPNTRFTMGAPRREQGRRANEIQHQVTLSRPFYLSIKEVSNAEFKKFRSSHSSSHFNRKTLDTGSQPVVRVSWLDAALYCNWLSEKEGLIPFYTIENGQISTRPANNGKSGQRSSTGYRLPTEAEWAWAARVDDSSDMLKYPWGNHFPPRSKTANLADVSANSLLPSILAGYRDSFSVSAPVGSFRANSRGLFDLAGNVSEWMHDYYGIRFDNNSNTIDPLGPDSGQYRVIRGSSWRHGRIVELRSSYRDYAQDNKSRDDLGFRVARYAE